MRTTPLAVLISGRGSNLKAILDFEQKSDCPYRTVFIFSDQPTAPGLKYATEHGIPFLTRTPADYPSREAFDRELHRELQKNGVELIALAGYMRLLSPWFVRQWRPFILNIHPSLLPAFPGCQAQQQALNAGVPQSGCTVFEVDEGMDTGPVLGQIKVPVLPTDTEESLSQRILQEEHRLFPSTLAAVALKKQGYQ